MAESEKFLNIKFPFTESEKGFFVELTKTTKEAVRSNLMHLLLTQKGDRLYRPDFGTNLRRFLFEQNDVTTEENIREDISSTIENNIPNLKITDIIIGADEKDENKVNIKVSYNIREDVFEFKDSIEITI